MTLENVRADYPWIDEKYNLFHQRLIRIGQGIDPSSGVSTVQGVNPSWLKIIGDTEFTDKRVAVVYNCIEEPRFKYLKRTSTVGNQIYELNDNQRLSNSPISRRLTGYLEHEQAFWTMGMQEYGIFLKDVAYNLYIGSATLSLCFRDSTSQIQTIS